MAKEAGLCKTLSEVSLGYHVDLLLDAQTSFQQAPWGRYSLTSVAELAKDVDFYGARNQSLGYELGPLFPGFDA